MAEFSTFVFSDDIFVSMEKSPDVCVDKYLVCGFCSSSVDYSDELLVKCGISNKFEILGITLKDFVTGCTKTVRLSSDESNASFEVESDDDSAGRFASTVDDLLTVAYHELSFKFAKRSESWIGKKITVTMKTSLQTVKGEFYVHCPEIATTKITNIHVGTAGNYSNIAGESIISTNQTAICENQRKPNLRNVFQSPGHSNLPEQVREAPDLLERYKICLKNRKTEGAKRVISEIVSMITNEINTTQYELWDFAREQLFQSNKPLESIPLFITAANMYSKEENGGEGLDGMRECVWGLWKASKKMVELNSNARRVVKNHVIPLMRKIRDDMEKVTSADEEGKCIQIVNALDCIGLSESKITEIESAQESYKEGLSLMKKTFGNVAEERRVYSYILEHLGDLYQKVSRVDDAISCYQQAINVYKAATDVDNGFRAALVKSCEKKLMKVQES